MPRHGRRPQHAGREAASALNYDLGIYAQDSWTLKRLTVNAGIRYEKLNAQVERRHVAGRPLRAGARSSPRSRTCRTGATGRRASRRSTTCSATRRPRSSTRSTATTWRARPASPTTTTRSLVDAGADRGPTSTATTSRRATAVVNGVRSAASYLTPGCEINFAQLPANFGTVALNDLRRLPADLEPRARPRAAARAVAAPVGDRQLVPRRLPQPDDDHQPGAAVRRRPAAEPELHAVHGLQPAHRRADHGLRAERQRRAALADATTSTRSIPNRERVYNAFNVEFRARPGAGAQIFGGFSFERQLRRQLHGARQPELAPLLRRRRRERHPVPRRTSSWRVRIRCRTGITVQRRAAEQQSPSGTTQHAGRMTITRGTTRYPADCPAPCPAGAIDRSRRRSGTRRRWRCRSSRCNASLVERINQLDFKVSKTFRFGRVTVLADVRDVQRQQLGRDHQLPVDRTSLAGSTWRRTASCSRA